MQPLCKKRFFIRVKNNFYILSENWDSLSREDFLRISNYIQVPSYSKYSNVQVLLRVPTLDAMMSGKIDAFLERKEIRDIFDIEFLYKKGIELKESPEKLIKILDGIKLFKKNDYKVKLGSLLEKEQREYYINENFKIIKAAINEKLKTLN